MKHCCIKCDRLNCVGRTLTYEDCPPFCPDFPILTNKGEEPPEEKVWAISYENIRKIYLEDKERLELIKEKFYKR